MRSSVHRTGCHQPPPPHRQSPPRNPTRASEFSKLIRDDPSVPADLRGFLSRAYAFKTIADYDPLTSVPPTAEDARAALETAARFVEEVVRLIGSLAATPDATDKLAP